MAKKLAKTEKTLSAPAPVATLPSAPPDQAPPDTDFESAVQLIEEFEGCVLHSYWDATGKVWTIGYGTTRYPDNSAVTKNQTCTKAQAETWMRHDLEQVRVPAILKMVKVPITNAELCALIDFAYNCGVGALQDSSLLKKLNAKDRKIDVAAAFLLYVKSGGRVLPGLVRRRKAERELFLTEPIGQIASA